jgi:hypothetical protein
LKFFRKRVKDFGTEEIERPEQVHLLSCEYSELVILRLRGDYHSTEIFKTFVKEIFDGRETTGKCNGGIHDDIFPAVFGVFVRVLVLRQTY